VHLRILHNNNCQTAGVNQKKKRCVSLAVYKLINILLHNSQDKITVGPKLIERYGRKVEKLVGAYVSVTEKIDTFVFAYRCIAIHSFVTGASI